MTRKKDSMKLVIAGSFKQLMQEHPFEKLTIQMIADRAGIMRSTFYHHFKDKYDLLDWLIVEEIITPAEKGLREHRMMEALRAMLCSVRADLPFYRKAAMIRGTNGFAESVCLHISELLEQELTQSGFTHVDGIPHLNARNLAKFYAYRVLFDILELLEEDSEYSIEEILDAYAYLDRHSADSFWGGNDPAEGRGFPKT